MKKRRIVPILILMLCVVVIISIAYYCHMKKVQLEVAKEAAIVAVLYERQNRTFPRTEGGPWVNEYMGADVLDERELFVCLEAYNNSMEKSGSSEWILTIEEVKDYFAEEYNEDGSLRILSGYEKIRNYEKWYGEGGDADILEYWNELEMIKTKYYDEKQNTDIVPIRELTVEQLQELIKKYENPSYEIKAEIIGDN